MAVNLDELDNDVAEALKERDLLLAAVTEAGQGRGQRISDLADAISEIGVSVAGFDSRISALEQGSPAPPPSGGGGGGGTALALIHMDDYSGNDDAKLASALSAARSRTLKTAVVLPNRDVTFTKPITAFTGMCLLGPTLGAGPVEQPRGNNPYPSRAKIRTSGSWLQVKEHVFGITIAGIAFEGNSSAIFAETLGGVLWTSHFYNLGFANFKHVLGTPAKQFLITAVTFDGYWNINNSYGTAVSIGGSDSQLWTDGCLIDSPPAFMPANEYHLRCLWLDKTNIGPLYMTAERCGGIYIDNSPNSQGNLVFSAARIEGRNAGTPSYGNLVRVKGGGVTFRDCWFGYAMTNPGGGVGGRGVIDIEDCDDTLFDGCRYGRANGVSESVPFIHASSGKSVRVVNTMRGKVWSGRPKVDGCAHDDTVID